MLDSIKSVTQKNGPQYQSRESKGGNKMSQIRMTPEQMHTRSGEVRYQGETFEGVINRMDGIINELQTEWEWQASQAFASQFQRLKPSFTEMRNLIDDIAKQLYATANAVEQLDIDIAGHFSG